MDNTNPRWGFSFVLIYSFLDFVWDINLQFTYYKDVENACQIALVIKTREKMNVHL